MRLMISMWIRAHCEGALLGWRLEARIRDDLMRPSLTIVWIGTPLACGTVAFVDKPLKTLLKSTCFVNLWTAILREMLFHFANNIDQERNAWIWAFKAIRCWSSRKNYYSMFQPIEGCISIFQITHYADKLSTFILFVKWQGLQILHTPSTCTWRRRSPPRRRWRRPCSLPPWTRSRYILLMGKSWYLDREEEGVGVLGGESPANDTKNLEFIRIIIFSQIASFRNLSTFYLSPHLLHNNTLCPGEHMCGDRGV